MLSRLFASAFLASTVMLSAGCATRYIPNTDVVDTKENRDLVKFCEIYRRAIEERDVSQILSMVSDNYYEDGGNVDPTDDMDLAGLREYLQGRFQDTRAIRYEIRYRRVEQGAKGRWFVVYTFSASYKIPGLKTEEEWHHTVADNRIEIEREGDVYKIVAGM